MPLGDSITQGIEFFDGVNDLPIKSERVGYRLSLYNSLTTDGVSFDFVGQSGQRAGEAAGLPDTDNNGYPGVDIDFINNVLDTVLDENQPDVILMHIGTNFTPSSAEGIEAIITKVNQWSQENTPLSLLIATLVPKRNSDQQLVDAFNVDLRERLLQGNADNVFLVEQALALDISDISTEEVGVHPNANGYTKMADTWLAALMDAAVVATCN
jgi:lysophospholipase L1-like esterase